MSIRVKLIKNKKPVQAFSQFLELKKHKNKGKK